MKKYKLIIALLAFSAIASAQTVPAYVPTFSLAAWYSFNGNAGDSSINANHGTVTGASLAPNRFGAANKAYYFNGTSNFIAIPPSATLELPDELTIMAWIKSDNYHTSDAQIFWRGDLISGYDPYSLFISGDSIKFRRSVGSGYTFHHVSIPVSIIDTSKFHLIVGTYSITDDTQKIYYDGVLYKAAYKPGALAYSTAGHWNTIGAVDHGTWQFYKGYMDDVGAWNRRLSDCEINKLYYATNNLITTGPINVTAASGGSAIFGISDTGGSATYQWQVDTGTGFINITGGGIYSGVTTKTLTVNPVSLALDSNRYRCIRTGIICPDTSAAAMLRVPGPSAINTIGRHTDDIYIIPNPNHGRFSFNGSFSSGYTGSITADVMDIYGKRIYSTTLNIAAGKIIGYIDIPEKIAKGNYLLKLQSEKDNKLLRFVIQ